MGPHEIRIVFHPTLLLCKVWAGLATLPPVRIQDIEKAPYGEFDLLLHITTKILTFMYIYTFY